MMINVFTERDHLHYYEYIRRQFEVGYGEGFNDEEKKSHTLDRQG